MVSLVLNGEQTFLDDNGNPLVAGQVYFYEVNTSTPKNTWQDRDQVSLNTNPVILDGAGRATIWGSGEYRQVLEDSLGNQIWDKVITDASYIPPGTLPISALESLSADVVLGAIDAGPVVEIPMTEAGRNIAGAADAEAQRDLLGLGTAALADIGNDADEVVTWAATGTLRVGNGTAAAPSYSFTSDVDCGMYRIQTNTIGWATNGANRITLDATGNFGKLFSGTFGSGSMCSLSDANTLQVASSAVNQFSRLTTDGSLMLFYRGTTQVGGIGVTGTGTSFNTTSDYRLKQNIEDASDCLETIMAITPREFEFKNDPSQRVVGFIAHELQDIVPSAVTGVKDGEETQQVDYSKLVPYLVGAIKELTERVEYLERAKLI